MTFFKLMSLGLILMLIMGIIRYIFHDLLADGGSIVIYAEWLFILLATTAVCRRLGVINFLEATLAAILWFLMVLFFDFLITSQFIGLHMFKEGNVWIGYLIMGLSVFWLHKKRHVHIRHELHGKH